MVRCRGYVVGIVGLEGESGVVGGGWTGGWRRTRELFGEDSGGERQRGYSQ